MRTAREWEGMTLRRFRGRDGVELAYREIGSGRPLVLLHGFTGDSAQWIDAGPARLLADHGFRVILPDLRGHGQSTPSGRQPDTRPEHQPTASAECHSDVHAGRRPEAGAGRDLEGRPGHGPDVGAGDRPDVCAAAAPDAHAVQGPDMRAAYWPDVLADDGLALVEQLVDRGLGGEYDLGGCSLGGRVVVRMLARGAWPGRAIVACQGLAAVTAARAGGQRDVLTALVNGEPPPDAQAAYWITQSGNDPWALLQVLDTHVPTPEAALRQITTPTLVMIGDQDGADADELAATLPHGRFVRVPGNHYTSLGSPEFATAALDFLNARRNVTHASITR